MFDSAVWEVAVPGPLLISVFCSDDIFKRLRRILSEVAGCRSHGWIGHLNK